METKPITPDEFAAKMRDILVSNGNTDAEEKHIAADRLLCDTLESLGYRDGARLFRNTKKWYA